MTCTAQGVARETGGATHDIQFIVSGRGDDSREWVEDEAAACLVRYRTPTCRPGIDLEQYTNDFDADTEPGPYIAPGDPVTWTFIVRNTGNQPLTDVRVTDSELGDICTIERLEVGASASCAQEGIARSGLFANVSSVTAEAADGDATVTDTDPCHYFNCAVDIEKATNGEDADQPPGPEIDEGEPITWTYVVTNTGGVTLTDLVVTDDQLGEVCRQPQLAPGADFDCVKNGISGDSITPETTQYANLATVQGYAWNALCIDSDPSHYRPGGTIPGALIALEKDPLPWTYIVTNTGELSLVDVVLTSDTPVQGPRPCPTPADTILPTGGVWCYDGNAPTRNGYGGAANVTAKSTPSDIPVFDALSPIPYDGLTLQLYLGEEEVLPGDLPSPPTDTPVTWRYVISNNTGLDLSKLQLWHTSMVKDATYALVCAPPSLAAGETIECSYSEVPSLRLTYIVGSVEGEATLDNVIELLSTDILRRYIGTPPVNPGNIEGRVFHDFRPADGIQEPAEPGIEGVTVTLFNVEEDEPVDTTVTDALGGYAFSAMPGEYRVHFAAPDGSFCGPNRTNNTCLDSDVDPASGLTPAIAVGDGMTQRCWDAGIVTPRLLLPLVEK
jgi:hypothetical protein